LCNFFVQPALLCIAHAVRRIPEKPPATAAKNEPNARVIQGKTNISTKEEKLYARKPDPDVCPVIFRQRPLSSKKKHNKAERASE
jgi:hypothetical protein